LTIEVQQRDQLERHSRFDELTGAERRSEFVRNVLKSGKSEGQTTIFTIKLLRFSSLVSTMGREVGDRLLQSMAERVLRVDERIDGVTRFDRESFAIRLVPGMDGTFANEFCWKILRKLAAPIHFNNQQITIDLCLGHATSSLGHEEDAQGLLNRAEFALKEAETWAQWHL